MWCGTLALKRGFSFFNGGAGATFCPPHAAPGARRLASLWILSLAGKQYFLACAQNLRLARKTRALREERNAIIEKTQGSTPKRVLSPKQVPAAEDVDFAWDRSHSAQRSHPRRCTDFGHVERVTNKSGNVGVGMSDSSGVDRT
eukprot:gene13910-biopygen11107